MLDIPAPLDTEIFARLPDEFRKPGRRSAWTDARQHKDVHSFLEGPSFDRAGNLYVTDIPFGRIFKVTPDGKFHLVAEYDGEPNGLKIHKDGRLIIADHKRGLLAIDPASGAVTTLLDRANAEGFRGLNDLYYARNGDLYFTDQGQSGLQDPSGRVFRLSAGGELTCVMRNIPSPNGLVLSVDETILYLNVTRANAVWKLPLTKGGEPTKAGLYLQLSGGSGPDGLAIDEQGGLAVAHAGYGAVWVFGPVGEPLYKLKSRTGMTTTNLAYGGADGKTLFITESSSGTILKAKLPTAGHRLYSHQ
jgi:gluconolactonase